MHRSMLHLAIAFMLLAMPLTAGAQAGSITGQVTDATTGRPIQDARVEATLPAGERGTPVYRTRTDEGGSFGIANLEPGNYSLFITVLGYQAQRVPANVAAGATARVTVAMTPAPTVLAEVVQTVGRRTEKVIDAPATVSVVPPEQMEERPASTITDQVRDLPGVDVASGGMMQANTVMRGFNNIFSGSVLTLTDHRFAFVPSLRVNVPYFLPETNEDVERIEVVLGPGAALYGPNTANGILHVMTRSPFAYQGTTLALDVGGNDLFRGGVRTAWAPTDKIAFKGSFQYFRADEFPTSPEAMDPEEVVDRDQRLRRAGGQARVDLRPWENTEIIANWGRSKTMNAVEPTGIGAGQVVDWVYDTFQIRGRYRRLFAQTFLNKSDAGETFLLRDGTPLVDKSTQWVAQAQHGFVLGPTDLLYGFDYQKTNPKTAGTINGRNEDDDDISEWGGYLHTVTPLSRLFEFVAAARVDNHSRVEDAVFSPRAAIVYKPSAVQNFRLTYNRAFSQPSTNNLFLDREAGSIGPLFKVRVLGVPQAGLQFGTCPGGLADLCMRVPTIFTGTEVAQTLPAQAALLYQAAVGVAGPGLIAAGVPQSLVQFMGTLQPTPAQVGTQLRVLNPTQGTFIDVAPGDLSEIPVIKPSISQGFEFGHKAFFFDRLQVVWDVWRERRTNFVGPLIVETPNVFLDRASLTTFLTAAFTQAFTAQGHPNPQQAAQQTAEQIAPVLAGVSGAGAPLTGVPLGVVNFDHALSSGADVILTYRNFGKLNVWGADLATELLLGSGFSMGGTYSHVNKDFFSREELGGISDIALNAPRNKGSLYGKYRNELTGIGGELRGRRVASFPVISGVWSDTDPGVKCENKPVEQRGACVESYTVVDAGFSWRPTMLGGGLWSVYAYNLFDKKHKQMAGGAQIGRLLVTRVQYTFF